LFFIYYNQFMKHTNKEKNIFLVIFNNGNNNGNNDNNGNTTTTQLSKSDFTYLGAFRLPDEFNWGALGMTFYADGNNGAGSLYITGFGPRPAEFGEISIPTQDINSDWEQLPMAGLISPIRSFDGNLIERDMGDYSEYSFASGIEVIPAQGSQKSPKLYGSIDCWYCVDDQSYPSVFFSELDGTNPRGMFHVGKREMPYHINKAGDFLFTVPKWYADKYLGGRWLITGKARGTETGSMGPSLLAFTPWDSENPSGDFDAVFMLYYPFLFDCGAPNVTNKALCTYPEFTMCDKWEGGSFIESGDKRAIIMAGRKGLGVNHYGLPRAGDCSMYKGYHCDPYEAQIIFYDIEELGEVALGNNDPWNITPYLIWRPDVFYNMDNNGQSCSEIGGMAYDSENKKLYLIEKSLPKYNTDDKAVVHVWSIN